MTNCATEATEYSGRAGSIRVISAQIEFLGGTGAVALAALLAERLDARGKTVALTLSGANVDPQTYREALEQIGVD